MNDLRRQLKLYQISFFSGIRIVDTNGHAGDVARGERDRARLHIRNTKTSAHDHVRRWKGPHPDMPELARPSSDGLDKRSAHVRFRVRRNGVDVQRGRQRTTGKSKADDV